MSNPFSFQELVKPEWYQNYKDSIETLWDEIVYLNTYEFLLRKIGLFPWSLLGGVKHEFWRYVELSFYQTCVSILYRAVVDRHHSALTLKSFKDDLRKNLVSEEVQDTFDERLKEIGFKKRFRELEKLVKEERSHRIAHLDKSQNVPRTQIDNTARSELYTRLGEATSLVNDFFNALSLDAGRAKLPIEYQSKTLAGAPVQPDVEELLDLIARDSAVLNMPEQQPEFWPMYKDNISAKEMTVLNQYRSKFGLPAV